MYLLLLYLVSVLSGERPCPLPPVCSMVAYSSTRHQIIIVSKPMSVSAWQITQSKLPQEWTTNEKLKPARLCAYRQQRLLSYSFVGKPCLHVNYGHVRTSGDFADDIWYSYKLYFTQACSMIINRAICLLLDYIG